jgi:hypothetical protein
MQEDFFESEFYLLRSLKSFSMNRKITDVYTRSILNKKTTSFHNFLIKNILLSDEFVLNKNIFRKRVFKRKSKAKLMVFRNNKKINYKPILNQRLKFIKGNDKNTSNNKNLDSRHDFFWNLSLLTSENKKARFISFIFHKVYRKSLKMSLFGRFLNRRNINRKKKKNKSSSLKHLLNFTIN